MHQQGHYRRSGDIGEILDYRNGVHVGEQSVGLHVVHVVMSADAISHDDIGVAIPLGQRLVFVKAYEALVIGVEMAAIDVRGGIPVAFETAEDCFVT